MGLGDLIRNVTDALTGDRKPDQPEVRPASEDPYGDPADPLAGQNIRPASEDPYGDPADQLAGQDIRPASEDPYGDPADLPYGANVRPASEDPFGDPADAGGIYDAVQQQLGATDPAWTRQQVERHVGMLPAGQADNLAGTVMNLISQSGVDVNGLCSRLGFSPEQCGAHLSQLLGYLHQNHPDALAQAASREPGLAGLLSDPSAGGILGSLASRFLGGRR
jgi:hypothetical protein